MGAQGMPGPQGYSGDEVSEMMIIYTLKCLLPIYWGLCITALKMILSDKLLAIFFKQGRRADK